jgi:hypothetical protein
LQCVTAECICKIPEFFYAHQHTFDEANLLCDVNVPTAEVPSPEFQNLGEMLTDFCSKEGFVLSNWIIDLVGYKEENGKSVGKT